MRDKRVLTAEQMADLIEKTIKEIVKKKGIKVKDRDIVQACKRHGVDEDYIRTIIRSEIPKPKHKYGNTSNLPHSAINGSDLQDKNLIQ